MTKSAILYIGNHAVDRNDIYLYLISKNKYCSICRPLSPANLASDGLLAYF
jgi:hypothetical protein